MRIEHNNSGMLFINDKRNTKDHPSMKGSIKVDGKEYWVAAWTKPASDGRNYLSLSVESKELQYVNQIK